MRSRIHRRSVIAGLGQTAALPAAALIVHQLRYVLAYGGHADVVLARTGHSYLHSLVPWLVLLMALALGVFLRSFGRALAGQTSMPRYTLSLATLWLLCSAALVAIFAGQEFLEGLFATGHPAGWSGIFGYGGWWAIPVALCVGLTLAAWLHGARWVLQEVARRGCASRLVFNSNGDELVVVRARAVTLTRMSARVKGWSGRGPPGRASGGSLPSTALS